MKYSLSTVFCRWNFENQMFFENFVFNVGFRFALQYHWSWSLKKSQNYIFFESCAKKNSSQFFQISNLSFKDFCYKIVAKDFVLFWNLNFQLFFNVRFRFAMKYRWNRFDSLKYPLSTALGLQLIQKIRLRIRQKYYIWSNLEYFCVLNKKTRVLFPFLTLHFLHNIKNFTSFQCT